MNIDSQHTTCRNSNCSARRSCSACPALQPQGSPGSRRRCTSCFRALLLPPQVLLALQAHSRAALRAPRPTAFLLPHRTRSQTDRSEFTDSEFHFVEFRTASSHSVFLHSRPLSSFLFQYFRKFVGVYLFSKRNVL